MPESEPLDHASYRCFRFGYRVCKHLCGNGYVLDFDNIHLLIRKIAEGEITLIDPENEAARISRTNFAVVLRGIAKDQEDARRLLDYERM